MKECLCEVYIINPTSGGLNYSQCKYQKGTGGTEGI